MYLTVNGTRYELPALDTINIGEAKIIQRHSGMTLDQLFEIEGLDSGAIGGLLAVAIKRSDPSLRDSDVDALVDAVNMFEIMEELANAVEEAPDPTQDEAPPLDDDSKPSSGDSISSSGIDGNGASEHSPEQLSPVSTGAPTSDTQDSDPMTLEA